MTEGESRFGRYEVVRRIGEGGFGEVLLARDPLLGRDVAVKVPRGPWSDPEQGLAEARALARLSHPAIVQVLDAGVEGGVLHVVLELVDGSSLEDLLERRLDRPLSPAAAVSLLRGPAAAVDHAHAAGVLHRDLKPANLLVPRRVERSLVLSPEALPPDAGVKVADFGLAALAAQHGPTPTRSGVGDPRYVAPEAWRGSPDKSSDVFALAAIGFRLLAGRPPLQGSEPREWIAAAPRPERLRLRDAREDLPGALDGVFCAALSGRRHERPRTGAALVSAIEGAMRRDDERRRFVRDARNRIAAHDKGLGGAGRCVGCGRALSPRAHECPHCGEPC